jgi:hypothetical protein
LSQDPAFLAVGSAQELQNITGQKLKAYLGNPQALNGYTYVANNPLRLTDPTGETLWDVVTGQQSWGSYVVEIGDGANYLYNNNSVARVALDHPIGTGAVVGIGGGLAAYGASVGITYGLTELGLIGGSQADKAQEIIKSSPQIGQRIPSLGRVIENAPGKITGFNHNGSFHGIDQIISRGVSPQTLLNTVENPLIRFSGRFDRTGYLTKEAYVVLDKAGQVVTSWTNNQFGKTITDVLDKIK